MSEDNIPSNSVETQTQDLAVQQTEQRQIHLVDSVMTDPTLLQAVEVSQGLIGNDSSEIPKTVVQDEEKAWDIAHASHETHSNADELRQAAARTEELFNAQKNKDEEASTEAMASIIKNPKHGPDLAERLITLKEASAGEQESSVAKGLRKDAEIIDNRASLIEDWAGVLHDHPVSDELKARNPDIELTATNLADLQEVNDEDLQVIALLERDLEDMDGLSILRAQFDPDSKNHSVEYLMQRASDQLELKALVHDWAELQQSPHTTLGQIKEFYAHLYETAIIRPRKMRAQVISNLLKEIRSGSSDDSQAYVS